MYLLGYDLGTSSIKVALVEEATGRVIHSTQSPAQEMSIDSPAADWAEQNPTLWWEHVCLATRKLMERHPEARTSISAIGLSYQMHGLVLLDHAGEVVRPSIIWCDSRAVAIGAAAADVLDSSLTYERSLNAPGNFTASKLKWVKEHEPQHFAKASKMMLPGDYIAYRMTGEVSTTMSGLSEGILWDFQENSIARELLRHYGLSESLIPSLVPTFGDQGKLTATAAEALGLPAGVPVTYRAGDQPNNALSLNVLQPGEVAATGGTSGVVYGVTDQLKGDPFDRVNSFAHVNHTSLAPRIGVLLCINGAGSLYAWLRSQVSEPGTSYGRMEEMAAAVGIGSEGLRVMPFGNGAERLFQNRPLGAHMLHLNFARHQRSHLFRAGLEGIAFTFAYGMEAMQEFGIDLQVMRVGNDNLFQSAVFANTLATLTGSTIEVRETTGAVGAAIAAGVHANGTHYLSETLSRTPTLRQYDPQQEEQAYHDAYSSWLEDLAILL